MYEDSGGKEEGMLFFIFKFLFKILGSQEVQSSSNCGGSGSRGNTGSSGILSSRNQYGDVNSSGSTSYRGLFFYLEKLENISKNKI
jgi:hypothetical protein